MNVRPYILTSYLPERRKFKQFGNLHRSEKGLSDKQTKFTQAKIIKMLHMQKFWPKDDLLSDLLNLTVVFSVQRGDHLLVVHRCGFQLFLVKPVESEIDTDLKHQQFQPLDFYKFTNFVQFKASLPCFAAILTDFHLILVDLERTLTECRLVFTFTPETHADALETRGWDLIITNVDSKYVQILRVHRNSLKPVFKKRADISTLIENEVGSPMKKLVVTLEHDTRKGWHPDWSSIKLASHREVTVSPSFVIVLAQRGILMVKYFNGNRLSITAMQLVPDLENKPKMELVLASKLDITPGARDKPILPQQHLKIKRFVTNYTPNRTKWTKLIIFHPSDPSNFGVYTSDGVSIQSLWHLGRTSTLSSMRWWPSARDTQQGVLLALRAQWNPLSQKLGVKLVFGEIQEKNPKPTIVTRNHIPKYTSLVVSFVTLRPV